MSTTSLMTMDKTISQRIWASSPLRHLRDGNIKKKEKKEREREWENVWTRHLQETWLYVCKQPSNEKNNGIDNRIKLPNNLNFQCTVYKMKARAIVSDVLLRRDLSLSLSMFWKFSGSKIIFVLFLSSLLKWIYLNLSTESFLKVKIHLELLVAELTKLFRYSSSNV